MMTPQWILMLLALLCSVRALADDELPVQSPDGDRPTDVRLSLNINKIHDIRPVAESFNLDAYLAVNWRDQRAGRLVTDHRTSLTFEDEQLEEWHGKLWMPALEIINILGSKSVSNRRLIVYADGRVFYNERFSATLHAPMNFRRFPFDTQLLRIVIEPFSYSASKLRFSELSRVYPTENAAWPMLEWRAVARSCRVGEQQYEYLADSTAERKFAQFAFTLQVERLPGYFVLQIILPLAVIMLCAWSVFFVKDGATQLSLISTLMLTVYAFNFFITDSLPKLPYGTFLGKLITISFIAIFLQLLVHVLELRSGRELTARQNAAAAGLFVAAFLFANLISWYASSMTAPLAVSDVGMIAARSCVNRT